MYDKQVDVKEEVSYTRSEECMDIVDVVRNSIQLFERYVYPDVYSIIKSKLLFAGDMKIHLKANGDDYSTAEVYPLIQSIHDSFVANLYDTNVSPRIAATKSEHKDKAAEAQNFLDWANDVSGAEEVKQLVRSEAALIGTSYAMCDWYKRTKTVNLPTGKSITKKTSKPILSHVSFFELFYDISTRDFYNTRRKARRKIMSTDNIVKGYKAFYEFTEEDIEKINDTIVDCISVRDYSKVYNIKQYEHLIEDMELTGNVLEQFMNDNVLTTIDEDNKFNEVVEFYTEEELVILVNGHEYIRVDNPFITGDPFAIITYEKQLATCMGIGLGQKLMPYQRAANMYWCNIKDAVIQHLKPMYTSEVGKLKDVDGDVPFHINYVPGKVLQIEDAGGLVPMRLTNTDAISIAVSQLDSSIAKAYEAIGTNSYVQGGQGKVERSLGAANMKVAIAMTRLKPLNHAVGAFEKKIFEQWLLLASIYLTKEDQIRVFNEDGNAEYHTVDPLDLMEGFDITVDVDSLREISKNERTQGAINLLNSIAPFNINPISQTPAIRPEDVIQYMSDELDYGLKPMKADERMLYAQEHIEIQKKIQEAQQPAQAPEQGAMPQMPMPIPQDPNAPIDLPMLA